MEINVNLDYVDCWVPVTALHVYGDYLFTGSGNKLELWSITDLEVSSRLLASKRLSGPFSIHGIETKVTSHNLMVIVFGNRYLTILEVIKNCSTNDSSSFQLEYVQESIYLGEWVSSIKLHENYIFVVLIDNSFITVDIDTWKTSAKIFSPKQCIIYSSFILSINSCENVLIASGTPFKTTSIWYHKNGTTKTIATIKHHEGAVFAIEYCYSSNILFTASDDRCINVWYHYDCLLDEPSSWSCSKFVLRHQLYGHTARIFSLKTLDGYLISCGENEEICIWSPYSGSLLFKSNNSDGSTIWCLAVSQNYGTIFVGSNDTSVKKFTLRDKLTSSKRISGQHLQDFCQVPKFIKFFNSSTRDNPDLLCVTDNGRCSILYVHDNLFSMERSIYLGETYESYCVGCLSDKSIFFCANRFGNLKVINLPSMTEKYSFQAHQGKILTCLLVSDTILLTSGVNGEIKLWNESENQMTAISNHQLPSCRHRWATCALLDNDHLIVGDASGHLSVFSISQLPPIQSLRGVHNKHGITDLKFHPVFKKTVFSSGRDRQVIEYLWTGETLTKLRLMPIKIEFDWIERIQFDSDNELILTGFSSKNFVVWRKVDSSRLWTVNCGGGHRLWDFRIVKDFLNFTFYCKSDLHIISRLFGSRENANPFIKPKFHSSKINCCCLVDYNDPIAIIATGGEDCDIILSEFNSSNGQLRNIDTCKGHISAVRALEAIKKPDGTILIISAGGQSQLIVWSVKILKGQRMVITQMYNNLEDDKNLKRSHLTLEKYNYPISRYLTINIMESESPDEYFISLTSSDSFVKIFLLNETGLIPFKQIYVSDYCPLALHRINKTLITGSNDGYLRFWIINKQLRAVDDVETLERQIEKLQLSIIAPKESELISHESGINCIDSRQIKDDVWLVVSSGDDAMINASLVKMVNGHIDLIVRKRVDNIHISQISVVSILDDLSLITCSIDQKMTIWNYSVNAETDDITIYPILSRLVSVADISASAMLHTKPDRFVIITGVGIEILKVSE